MKYISIFLIFISSLSAQVDVLMSSQVIKYKDFVTLDKLKETSTNKKLKRDCIPITVADITNGSYLATHYIAKNKVICKKDIKAYERKTVIFNFGSFEIEKEGEIIYQNENVVKIRKPNGKVEKIYKNGVIK